MTPKIKAENALFIKLGAGGEFVQDCIENNILKVGYNDLNQNLCLEGNWEKVKEYYIGTGIANSTAAFHKNAVKRFYTEDEHTLWITFSADKLWWCFSKREITLLPDNSKTRPVIGKWSDKDITGQSLFIDSLKGQLTMVQRFAGTICKVREDKYLLLKINAEELPEIKTLRESLGNLNKDLGVLIQSLQWKDFEILIDLIFRQAGWQRTARIGGVEAIVDLRLITPVTNERAVVQIRSQSNLEKFRDCKNHFDNMKKDHDKFFYVVHSPADDLTNYSNETEIDLWFNDTITKLVINSGLIEWVIKKTS